MSHLLDLEVSPFFFIGVCVLVLASLFITAFIMHFILQVLGSAPGTSNAMCLAVGHRWEKSKWVLHSIPASEVAWFAGMRLEHEQEQHCTRKGCCGYRIRLQKEGGEIRVITIRP